MGKLAGMNKDILKSKGIWSPVSGWMAESTSARGGGGPVSVRHFEVNDERCVHFQIGMHNKVHKQKSGMQG